MLFMFMLCVYFVLQTVPPVVLRAKTVKAQIAEMDQLKHKMEIKEDSVKELKLQIMKKVRGQSLDEKYRFSIAETPLKLC